MKIDLTDEETQALGNLLHLGTHALLTLMAQRQAQGQPANNAEHRALLAHAEAIEAKLRAAQEPAPQNGAKKPSSKRAKADDLMGETA